MQLSKKWTVAGILLALSGFFLHPGTCVSGTDILNSVVPAQYQDYITNIALFLGTILATLGKGLLHKEPVQ